MTDSNIYRAKKVLLDYVQLNKEVAEKEERIQHLFDSATRATPSLEAERVSGTSEHSRLEANIVRKVDLEAQLDSRIDELRAQNYRIQNAIDAMLEPRERRLLHLRYLEGRSWASVNTRLGVSETWSRVIHDSALAHFAEIFFG